MTGKQVNDLTRLARPCPLIFLDVAAVPVSQQ